MVMRISLGVITLAKSPEKPLPSPVVKSYVVQPPVVESPVVVSPVVLPTPEPVAAPTGEVPRLERVDEPARRGRPRLEQKTEVESKPEEPGA